jgi:hypothetical protein
VNENCSVPTCVEIVAEMSEPLPRPAGATHANVVADDHPIVWHAVSPILADGVTSACAKSSPWIVPTVNPDVAPFDETVFVTTGASNVKLLTSVPPNSSSATIAMGMAAELAPIFPAEPHETDESVVQLVVRHSCAESSMIVAVASRECPKFTPINVNELGPKAGTLTPWVNAVATAASNENALSCVPTEAATVTEKGLRIP